MDRFDVLNDSLYSAVGKGDLERAREIINSHGLFRSEGYFLLRDAIKNKRTAAAKLILTYNCRVNRKSRKPCRTPLHFAAKNGDIEIVKMLLDKGANIDAKNKFGKTPLHYAVEINIEVTELLLKHGADVNTRNNDGQTPLHFAVENNAMEVTELLLKHGADVNTRDNDSVTPLHEAIDNRCLQIVEHLLNNGAYVNYVCTSSWGKGYAPLHFAVRNGSEKVVTLLLSSGAHVDVKGEDGVTPLHIAAKKGYISIVEDLLTHGASIHSLTLKGDCTPLYIATKRGRETVVKLLLQHGAEVDNRDKYNKTVLHLAVEIGNLTIVEDVLKYCPDINDQSNRSALKIAVHGSGEKYKKIVEALLEYGFSVGPEDANDPMLLHDAVERGYLKVIEDLLKYGADVNMLYNLDFYKGFTPLHSAAKHKQEEVAKLLISYGADINAQYATSKTPIFYATENVDIKIFDLLLTNGANIKDSPELLNIAVEKGCMEIVEVLLQHDVDVKASDEYGRTALHYIGSFESHLGDTHINIKGEIAKLLISKGANVDAQTRYGETPLHRSAQKGDKQITIMLINKGANVNAEQKDGTTPLHFASQKGHEVVKVLLENGAKVDSKTKDDVTPLHFAAQYGCQEIIKTILKFGADINYRKPSGETALHLASEELHVEVVETLLNYGADINVTSRNNRTPLDYAISVGSYQYDKIVETFKQHIVKMKTANLYVSEKNLQSVNWSYEMREFQNKCEEEISSMKNEKFNNLNISFYDILAKCTSSLPVYMRNENIVQVLKSGDYKSKYPIYATMIKTHFKKGMERKELLEQANNIFHLLFNTFPELPYYCTEEIFSYLSEEDLKNFNRCLQAS